MQANHNASSIQMILPETMDIFHKIELELEQYIAEKGNAVYLDNIAELLTQVRGIMVMVELPATIEVIDECIVVLKKLETCKEDDSHKLLTALCLSIAVLPRYLEFIKHKNHGLPFLLLPTINELRHRVGKPIVNLSYFFRATKQPNYPSESLTDKQMAELQKFGPALLNKYQLALKQILNFGADDHTLLQLAESVEEIERITKNTPINEVWILSKYVITCFADKVVKFTKPRRRIFVQIEKLYRAVVEDAQNCMMRCPDDVKDELLLVIALTDPRFARYKPIKDAYRLPAHVANEKQLLQEYYKFKGPSASALATAFTGIQEELSNIIDILNPNTFASNQSEGVQGEMIDDITRLSKALVFLNRKEGQLLHRQLALLNSPALGSSGEESKKIVSALALALTQINVSLARAIADPFSNRKSPLDAKTQVVIRTVSEKNSFEDARKDLQLICNGLSDFIATREASHIEEVPGKIKKVCEGLTYIKVEKAPEILYQCFNFVEKELKKNDAEMNQKKLSILADAITGIDYYLECQLTSQPVPAMLLEQLETKVKNISAA